VRPREVGATSSFWDSSTRFPSHELDDLFVRNCVLVEDLVPTKSLIDVMVVKPPNFAGGDSVSEPESACDMSQHQGE